MSGITTTIKIKPYLKEFILCRYLSGQYKATADDALGVTIKPFLISPPSGLVKIPATPDDQYFTFELPNYSDKKVMYHNYIEPVYQKYIEDIFERLFRDAMFHHIEQNLELNFGKRINIKDWIYNWCQLNSVTFANTNYETLKKAFYRYRQDLEKNEKIATRLFPLVSPKFHYVVPQLSPKNKPEVKELETEVA